METPRTGLIENELEAILRTLENFAVVPAGETGGILYSARQTDTDLPINLRVASAASALGLSSLDHVRKTYLPADDEGTRRPVVEAYAKACRIARMHMAETRADLASSAASRVGTSSPVGVTAGSVALQRLESGFIGAQLLYRIGLNIEGDAVARQVLEQISWATKVYELDSLEAIESVEPQKTLASLKRLLPEAGPLNGSLSNVTHAGVAVHRSIVERSERGHELVVAQERLSRAADVLLILADAWVLACEFTQRDYLSRFRAIESRDNPVPNPSRSFRNARSQAVQEIRRLEVD